VTELATQAFRDNLLRLRDAQLFTHAFFEAGFLTEDEPRERVELYSDHRRIFDLASLTKVLSTAPLTYRNITKRGLTLRSTIDQAFRKQVVDIPTFIQGRSIGEILGHRSGLPAWRNFWTLCEDENEWSDSHSAIIRGLSRLQPSDINDSEIYSDIGYILMGLLLERKTADRLSELFFDFKEELDLDDRYQIGYLDNIPDHLGTIPTGFCHVRRRMVTNEIHDENAHFIGGDVGHTGLFASGEDLSAYLRNFLLSHFGKKFVELSFHFEKGRWKDWTIGFRKADDKGSSLFAENKGLGHYGFTGTSFWYDPVDHRYVIFLTNRTYFNRLDKRIAELRREASQVAYDILGS